MKTAKSQRERPTRIGPYQLLAKIGEGGMGTVHLAKVDGPAGFNKLAVVKELRSELADTPELVQMFLDEAGLAARLTHPNVVHTYGANEDAGRLCLAMEYLDGQPWSRVRRVLWERASLELALHVKVLADVLAGLHYAHERRDYDGTALSIVHCDMSPQNVFVTYDGQVKIVDFGVARAVTGNIRISADVIVGKLAYIAPEQARGDVLDRRADIFSVGVMLWEALAGRRFADDSDWSELRRRRTAGLEPRVRMVAPNVPAGLAEICDRALALEPEDRFKTAAEFRDALLDYLAEDFQDGDHARLGELVSAAFAGDRARVHAVIERHMRQPSGLKSSVEDLVASLHPGEPVEHTLKADLSELASVSRLRDDVAAIEASNSASIRLARRKRPRMLLGLGLAALLLTAAWLLLRPGPDTRALGGIANARGALTVKTSPSGTGRAAPVGAPGLLTATQPSAAARSDATASATIQLVVTANPPQAVLLLDGVQLPANPYVGRLKSDAALHRIRASGPGLHTQERILVLDRDHLVSFNLSAARSSRASARPSRRQAVPAAPPPIGAAATAPVEAVLGGAPLTTGTKTREIYDEDPYQ